MPFRRNGSPGAMKIYPPAFFRVFLMIHNELEELEELAAIRSGPKKQPFRTNEVFRTKLVPKHLLKQESSGLMRVHSDIQNQPQILAGINQMDNRPTGQKAKVTFDIVREFP